MYPRARARVPYVPGCARAECGDQQRVAAARVLLHGQHCAPHPPARERACVLQVSCTERHRTAASRTSRDGRSPERSLVKLRGSSQCRTRQAKVDRQVQRCAAHRCHGQSSGIPASHWHPGPALWPGFNSPAALRQVGLDGRSSREGHSAWQCHWHGKRWAAGALVLYSTSTCSRGSRHNLNAGSHRQRRHAGRLRLVAWPSAAADAARGSHSSRRSRPWRLPMPLSASDSSPTQCSLLGTRSQRSRSRPGACKLKLQEPCQGASFPSWPRP